MSELFERAVLEVVETHYLPIIKRLEAEIKSLKQEDKFINYPKGLEQYLGKSYDVVYRLWSRSDFPRAFIGEVKGVFESDLKKFSLKCSK